MSADGVYRAAAFYEDTIYLSNNSGATWHPVPSNIPAPGFSMCSMTSNIPASETVRCGSDGPSLTEAQCIAKGCCYLESHPDANKRCHRSMTKWTSIAMSGDGLEIVAFQAELVHSEPHTRSRVSPDSLVRVRVRVRPHTRSRASPDSLTRAPSLTERITALSFL